MIGRFINTFASRRGEIILFVTIFVIACAIVLGSTLQRISGTGISLVLSPLLTVIIGPVSGVLITNIASVTCALMTLWSLRKNIDWRAYAFLLPFGLAGIFPGIFLIHRLAGGWIKILIGGFVLLSMATTFGFKNMPKLDGRGWKAAASLLGGFANSTSGMTGSVMVLYARMSDWPQRTFAATMQPFFLTLSTTSIIVKLHGGLSLPSQWPAWLIVLICVCSIFCGEIIGGHLSQRISPKMARNIALTVACLGAAIATITGILSLMG